MIGPTGDVWLGHVPWNNSYNHVWWEGALNKTLIINEFMSMHTTNYTFIREDTNIRVPYNADDIYGVNYCMYQNDGMWFCCFVNTITYVNNGVSLLHLEEDVWHTWGEFLDIKPCLVDREHVNSDRMGEWRAPEPEMQLEEFTVGGSSFSEAEIDTVVIGTNAIPHLKNSSASSSLIFEQLSEDQLDGSDAVSGGLYGNIMSGAKYYGFNVSNVNQRNACKNFLDNLNKCGAAESVCCMFMTSSHFLTFGSGYEVQSSSSIVHGTIVPVLVHGGNYTPKNAKCFTFPYSYVSIVDYSGGSMDIKYEDCDTYGSVKYRIQEGLDPTCQMILTMEDYQGQQIDTSHMMPLNSNPQCPWVYSSYQNWAAQNAANIDVKREGEVMKLVGGAAMAAIGAVLLHNAAIAAEGGMTALGAITSKGGMMAGAGIGTMLGTAYEEDKLKAEIDMQSKIPAHLMGGSSGNSLQAIMRNTGGYVCHGLQAQSARRLDAFFDVFGYAIDQVKLPNFTGRDYWNYLKTVGANMGGNIPTDRLATINRCLDSGITLWHTSDVGNYLLDNSLTTT